MRKAGALFTDFLREKMLAKHRENPIGIGGNAVVYQSDQPGNVMKQGHIPDGSFGRTLEEEADLQAIAAEAGLAPRVAGLELFPGGVGNRIEMEDVRNNFESLPIDPMIGVETVSSFSQPRYSSDLRKLALQQAQQMGTLALKGVRLEDRHSGNVMRNKMTGRPLQLDFGIAGRVEGSEKAATLALATAEGFEAAGIGDVGSILIATVMDYLEGGQVDEAMDLAKQGFSRLQKIKTPLAK